MGHLVEANCECGASWNLVTDDVPDDLEVECQACDGTVVDFRDLGLAHSAGGDVALLLLGVAILRQSGHYALEVG